MAKYLFIMANEGHRWGGSEPLWAGAAEHLVKRGNQVRVSVRRWWGEPVSQIENLKAAGCQVFYRRNYPPFFYRHARRIFPLREYKQKELRRMMEGVDLVVISQGDNVDGLPWMEAVEAAGYKYAVIAQSAVVYWWPDDDVAERSAKAYEKASGAYFVSQAVLDLSRLEFATPLRHGKVVRNPFNVRYDVKVPWPSDGDGGLSLACVGRLDIISKGHDVVLQVLAQPRWRERNVRLSFIGEGPHERGLRRMAKHFGLANVDFLGQRGDIEEIWRQHHALVLASRFEGMPLVLVEAMLCGRPGIVTDVGGNRELVRDGVNGFLAKAPTVELLDEAMNRAWENRHRLKEMGNTAAKDVREWVSPDPAGDFANELERLAAEVQTKPLDRHFEPSRSWVRNLSVKVRSRTES
jgi:glycosyltransferase involved in cell wall biosynthesis